MTSFTNQPERINLQITNDNLFSTDFAQHERQCVLRQLNTLPTWAWEYRRLLIIGPSAQIHGCVVHIYKILHDFF